MNVVTYLIGLRDAGALPFSIEGECARPTNSEIRRWLLNKAVLLNGERDWKWDEEMPCFVWQLVFFPKAVPKNEEDLNKIDPKTGRKKVFRRTTLLHYDFEKHHDGRTIPGIQGAPVDAEDESGVPEASASSV